MKKRILAVVSMKKTLAVVLIVVAYAIAQTTKTPQSPKQPTTTAQNHAGKYQIFFSPHARADVYLLDTETGQIWRPITITNAKDANLKSGAPEIWMFQERVDNAQEFEIWSSFHTPGTPAAAQPK
jgi:hypothetical protein